MVSGMQPQSFSRIDMAYGLKNSASFVGQRSISGMVACTSIEQRAELRAYTRFGVLSFGPCGHYRATALMCSSPKRAVR